MNGSYRRFVNLEAAEGDIDFPLTNDVVFHISFQRSKKALKGFICALLDLDPGKVSNVILLNPINYGDEYDGKGIIMDLRVLLDNKEFINVELQLILGYTKQWWINRSMLYLCRCFDNIKAGEDYLMIKPATHISIVMDDIFPEEKSEFYATYSMLNCRTYKPYTCNFNLHVLYLNHIELAKEEGASDELIYWAKTFRATKWEELKVLANQSEYVKEVANTMLTVNQSDHERSIALAHEKYVLTAATWRHLNEIEKARADAAEAALAEKDMAIAEMSSALAEKDSINRKNEELIDDLMTRLKKYEDV